MPLHIVNTRNSLEHALQHIADDDSLLLIEAAVLTLADNCLELMHITGGRNLNLYALTEDAVELGLKPTEEAPAQWTDMEGFITLCESHQPIISW